MNFENLQMITQKPLLKKKKQKINLELKLENLENILSSEETTKL